MSTSEWLITAPPVEAVNQTWRQSSLFEPVFPEPPEEWKTRATVTAVDAAVAALGAAFYQLGSERARPLATIYDPPPEPWQGSSAAGWELILVVDTSASMTPWFSTANAIIARARDVPLFDGVHVVRLRGSRLVTQQDVLDNASVLGDQQSPTRRKMILILTDGVGPAWRKGLIWEHLRAWATLHTVAVLHVLPHHMWELSGIPTRAVQLHAPQQGVGNRDLEAADIQDSGLEATATTPAAEGSVLIPVLEIRKRWIEQWARLLLTNLWVHQQVLEVPARPRQVVIPRPSQSPGPGPDANQLISTFHGAASEDSFTLAVLLAAAPLNRFVMQLIAARCVPTATTGDLSAILTSGLLTAFEEPVGVDDPYGEITFDFVSGVRQGLLALGESSQTHRVITLLDEDLSEYMPAIRGLSQRMRNPDAFPLPQANPTNLPYLRVESSLLNALSGESAEHRQKAEQFRDLLKSIPARELERETQ